MDLASRQITHGAYFKVLVPPPPDIAGDTAHAVRVARDAAEAFDFPMAGNLTFDILSAEAAEAEQRSADAGAPLLVPELVRARMVKIKSLMIFPFLIVQAALIVSTLLRSIGHHHGCHSYLT